MIFVLTILLASIWINCIRCQHRSHGLFRVPGYVHGLAHGGVPGGARPVVRDASPGLVAVDAAGGFALPAFVAGRSMLVDKARSQGIAALAVNRGRHFSALWWEVSSLSGGRAVLMFFSLCVVLRRRF